MSRLLTSFLLCPIRYFGLTFFICLISNMIISCNGTSIKETLLSGNDLERIQILVFLVLRDAGTFLKILCYGFNLNNAIKLKKEMRLYYHYHVFW